MKKLLTIMLCIIFVLSLVSCGDNGQRKAQKAVVDICEQFLDYKISASECCEKLDGMYIPEPEDGSYNLLKVSVAAMAFKLQKGDYEGFVESYEYIKGRTY